MISEKTVQSYIPYSRGMYGGERSGTAERSLEYRGRMGKAVKEMVNRDKAGAENGSNIIKIPPHVSEMEKKADTQAAKSGVDKMHETKADTSSSNGIDVLDGSRQGMLHRYVYRLRFDLVSSFLYGADEDLDMSDEEREEFLRLAKAKRGISRTVLLPGEMTLHAMHYMILRLFGWQNEHLHRFAIPKDVFDGLTGGKTRWKTCSIPSLSRRISIPYSRGSGYATFSPVLPELTMG